MSGPYRMIAGVTLREPGRGDAVWRPTGRELGPGSRPPRVPGTLLLEAAAQCAGLTLAGGARRPGEAWMLAGIETADADGAAWDVPLRVQARVLRRSAGTGTVAVVVVDPAGRTIATGRMLLVRRHTGGGR